MQCQSQVGNNWIVFYANNTVSDAQILCTAGTSGTANVGNLNFYCANTVFNSAISCNSVTMPLSGTVTMSTGIYGGSIGAGSVNNQAYLLLNVEYGGTREVARAQYINGDGPSCSFSAHAYFTSLSVQQPIQSTYSSAPTSKCIGYLNTAQSTTNVSMPIANHCYQLHSINIDAGTWLISGTASFLSTITSSLWLTTGISIGNSSSFDNLSNITTLPLSTDSLKTFIITLPQRYYSGTSTTVYILASIHYPNLCFGNNSPPSVLSAVRIA